MSILVLLLLILIFSVVIGLIYRSFRTSVRYSIPKGTQIYGDLISE